MGAPCDVCERFVYGNPLDKRREIIEHLDGSISQPLIILEMATDKDQVWAKLARPPSRHAATDSEGPGFI
jgi:hypothetical protein